MSAAISRSPKVGFEKQGILPKIMLLALTVAMVGGQELIEEGQRPVASRARKRPWDVSPLGRCASNTTDVELVTHCVKAAFGKQTKIVVEACFFQMKKEGLGFTACHFLQEARNALGRQEWREETRGLSGTLVEERPWNMTRVGRCAIGATDVERVTACVGGALEGELSGIVSSCYQQTIDAEQKADLVPCCVLEASRIKIWPETHWYPLPIDCRKKHLGGRGSTWVGRRR